MQEISRQEKNDPQTYAILGAAFEIHNQLGRGFLGAGYQEAAVVEFQARKIPFTREPQLPIHYKGIVLPCYYRADFICYGEVIVEFKALEKLTSVELSQAINYLKATGLHRGLLINFGSERLQQRRVAWGKSISSSF